MSKNNEKIVHGLRLPACAEILDVKRWMGNEIIAVTLNCNGIAVTFFRFFFLPMPKMIAWDDTEVFGENAFHEEIPEDVWECIRNEEGIFISRDFISTLEEKPVPRNLVAEHKLNQEYAKKQAASLEIPGMEANLIFGAVYDTMGKWLLETESLTEKEWLDGPRSKEEQDAILDRDCGGWTIRELFGNIYMTEWTQEMYQNVAVTREGLPFSDGEGLYPARKRYTYPTWLHHPGAMARTMWTFKKE